MTRDFGLSRTGAPLAQMACVNLIGDRFVRMTPETWFDLATGTTVAVTIAPLPSDWRDRERALQTANGPPADGTLVDAGRVGTGMWFEARTHLSLGNHCRRVGWQLAEEAFPRIAAPRAPGPTRVRVVPVSGAALLTFASQLARRARELGWVVVLARAKIGATLQQMLSRRHVMLVVDQRCEARLALAWIGSVLRVSSRPMIIVDARRDRRSTSGSSSFESFEVGSIGSALDRGDLDRAEALLNGLTAGASIAGKPLPIAAVRHRAELYFWQGRFDLAAAVVNRIPSREKSAWAAAIDWINRSTPGISAAAEGGAVGRPWWIARVQRADELCALGRPEDAVRALGPAADWVPVPALWRLSADWIRASAGGETAAVGAAIDEIGAHGIRRLGFGRKRMHLVRALPALLELLHEAEDESTALAAMCRRTREEHAVTNVAFVCGNDPAIVSSAGPIEPEWRQDLIGEIAHAAKPIVLDRVGAAFAIAPVRYLGARVGGVIVSGSSERAAALLEIAATLAAVVGPALHARSSALALARAAGGLAPEILGRSPSILSLRETIARAAATPFAVLIEGESGTGKELVARAVHRLSARRDRRWSAINCAALGDDLIEAELFGHARGAFTGAIAPRTGLFEEAHLGTLFLDEVAELTPRAQAKLLRAIQEREIRRLGENIPRPVDVRIIAATNRPMAAAVAHGLFREDLLFRLAVIRIRLAPLRERLEDVPMLAHAFWRGAMRDTNKRAVLGPDAIARLCRHEWPGNVRELQNAIAALAVAAPARGRVTARHVAHVLEEAGEPRTVVGRPLVELKTGVERAAVSAALARHAGRRTAAARELGLTRQGLCKAIRRLGLSNEREAGVA